jgi:hypothetical protein
VVDLAYRLLGVLLGARRPLVAAAAVLGAALWLLLLRAAVREADPLTLLALVALPVLYGLAGWRLFLLPPGAVFRAAALPRTGAPRPTARCRVSGYFTTRRGSRWRLLARASLTFAADGSFQATAPPPLLGGPAAAQLAFPTRGRPTAAQLRAGERTRHPEWVYQPEALVGSTSRRMYESPADYAAAVGQLDVPRAALADLATGWQYGGGSRWPALRLLYYGPDGRLSSAYLALGDVDHCVWAQDRLMGHGG